MNTDELEAAGWVGFFAGMVLFGVALMLILSGPSDATEGCIIVTEYGTVLEDPVPGEDDGQLYCPAN